MNNMDIEFVERTQRIIENYKGNYDFTLLLNCTLGLIILPLEVNRKQHLKFLNERLENIDVIKSILKRDKEYVFNPTWFNKKAGQYETGSKTLLTFLIKIRNGLAHFANSEPINENGRWTEIKLKDVNKFNDDNIELELTISEESLLDLTRYLSNAYLDEVKSR